MPRGAKHFCASGDATLVNSLQRAHLICSESQSPLPQALVQLEQSGIQPGQRLTSTRLEVCIPASPFNSAINPNFPNQKNQEKQHAYVHDQGRH